MPRNQVISPKETRKAGEITFKPVPVMQYKPDYEKEVKKYGVGRLKKIYYDMLVVREFETMLNLIKTQGAYEGMEYDHPGPAHLSIGQEAAAVGQAVNLTTEDYIFGSHRSHGEILAKCLSAVNRLDDKQLTSIMDEFCMKTGLEVPAWCSP